jgi:hypothetical protein
MITLPRPTREVVPRPTREVVRRQVDKRERSLGASAVFDVPGSLSKCQVLRHLLVGGEDQVSARRVIATTASRYWREIGAVRSSHR